MYIGKLKTTNKWHNTYRTNLETLPLPGVAPSGIKMKSNYPVIRLIIWNSCFDIVLIVVLSDAMLSDDENMRCLQIWSMYSIVVDSIIIFEPTPSTKKNAVHTALINLLFLKKVYTFYTSWNKGPTLFSSSFLHNA